MESHGQTRGILPRADQTDSLFGRAKNGPGFFYWKPRTYFPSSNILGQAGAIHPEPGMKTSATFIRVGKTRTPSHPFEDQVADHLDNLLRFDCVRIDDKVVE